MLTLDGASPCVAHQYFYSRLIKYHTLLVDFKTEFEHSRKTSLGCSHPVAQHLQCRQMLFFKIIACTNCPFQCLICCEYFFQVLQREQRKLQQVVNSLPHREIGLPGGVAMAAALATYLGPYHYNFRRVMLTIHWPNCLRERGIPLVVDSIDEIKGQFKGCHRGN